MHMWEIMVEALPPAKPHRLSRYGRENMRLLRVVDQEGDPDRANVTYNVVWRGEVVGKIRGLRNPPEHGDPWTAYNQNGKRLFSAGTKGDLVGRLLNHLRIKERPVKPWPTL